MNKKWWQKAIVYQIYPKSFQDTNQDGIGDLQGVIKRLDYLNELGVNVIWLCPVNESPMRDNGYDIADYYKIDPSFGTNEDLEALITHAASYGIKVVMDLVINHCSDQHKWFQEAVKNPESKYASYFIIEETEGEEPNNLRCYNGSSAWERIGNSSRFYFHTFSKEQPDLNWENEALRKEIIAMMKFWQEKGVAGFRVDAIGNIKKSKEIFERKIFPADGNDGRLSIDSFVLVTDGIEVYLRELRDEVFQKYDMMTVAEVNVPESKLPEFIGEDGLFSMVFDFSYTDLDVEKRDGQEWKKSFTMQELKEHIFASQKMLQNYGWGSPYLENHDQPRSINKYVPKNAFSYESKTALGTLYFFLRGTPFIYQGQELGMENYPFEKIEEIRDPFAIDRYERAEKRGDDTKAIMEYLKERGRDNSRTPMQWDSSVYAGFSTVMPWIAVNPDYTTLNAKQQQAEEKSVFHYYQEMIRLRSKSVFSDTLTFGDFEGILVDEEEFFCYKRYDDTYEIVIMVNLSNQEIAIPDMLKGGEIILNNREEIGAVLMPYQARIMVKRK
ncbi:alpha-glucosidase [Lachnospiraceae bacterium OttesenSCG-928-D06]|nr:alpha-glucosidase [Lachnospiraceae bacterium OttesenSCG-928-D06]